jgi:hypothetical protein
MAFGKLPLAKVDDRRAAKPLVSEQDKGCCRPPHTRIPFLSEAEKETNGGIFVKISFTRRFDWHGDRANLPF